MNLKFKNSIFFIIKWNHIHVGYNYKYDSIKVIISQFIDIMRLKLWQKSFLFFFGTNRLPYLSENHTVNKVLIQRELPLKLFIMTGINEGTDLQTK